MLLFGCVLQEDGFHGGSGTVRASLLRRMMRFYDPRFAQNTSFLFLVFSQAMRHEATQQVARLKDGAHIQGYNQRTVL